MAVKCDPSDSLRLWTLHYDIAQIQCDLIQGDVVVQMLQGQIVIRSVIADDHGSAQAIARDWHCEFLRATSVRRAATARGRAVGGQFAEG